MVVLGQYFSENLTLIEYHTWWPSSRDPFHAANEEENRARVDYYPDDELYEPSPSWYVPRIFFDGLIDGRFLYEDNTWFNMVAHRSTVESPLEITLDIDISGTEGTARAHITAEEDVLSPHVVIHFVLTESEIEYEAPNGVNLHHNVMRQMLPDEHGEPFTIHEGQRIDLSRDFTLQPEWVAEHLGLVVFVQDSATREVVQATRTRSTTIVSMIDHDLVDSGGDGDGNFEAGETVELTVTLINIGPLASDASASLRSDDADISILIGEVQFGDIPLNVTVDNTNGPFLFQVTQDVAAHFTTLTIDVTANGGEISFQDTMEILIGKPDILIVNDDHPPPVFPPDYNAERFYRHALYTRNETYHEWNTKTAGSPEGTLLNEYNVVIWFTGVSDPTLTSEDISTLTPFLELGGNLILSGQDIAADLQGTSFLRDYLHAEFVADSSRDTRLDPVPGDPITWNLNSLSILSGDYGANNQTRPDEIIHINGASPILTYHSSNRTAALRYAGDYRLVYFAIGFESIVDLRDPADSFALRADLLQQTLNWLQFAPQRGDVNEDSVINILDVVLMVNIILGLHEPTPGQNWAADMNENGEVNLEDIILVVNVILGR